MKDQRDLFDHFTEAMNLRIRQAKRLDQYDQRESDYNKPEIVQRVLCYATSKFGDQIEVFKEVTG